MPSPAEIAAYVGAAAWLPQIVALVYRAAVRPKVTIVPEKKTEIGYTSFGPIFNLRLAVSAARKDTIIDHVGASIRHEDGATHEFAWAGMRETFSEIKDLSGNMQFIERDYSPIALVLARFGVIERFFRFQLPLFHSKLKVVLRKATDHQAYLKSIKADYHEDLLNSKEVHDVLECYEQFFLWKSGRYTVDFSVKSPGKVILTKSAYVFDLKPYEIEDLKNNLPLLKVEAANLAKSDIQGFKPEVLNWRWVSTPLERIDEKGSNNGLQRIA
jgi:hypothetical protein